MEHMKRIFTGILLLAVTGCASYRTGSDEDIRPLQTAAAGSPVEILEGEPKSTAYRVIGSLEATVKKLTAFHPKPTRDQVNIVLRDKARKQGANAVMNVKYSSGVGFTTWGYLKAEGTAIHLDE